MVICVQTCKKWAPFDWWSAFVPQWSSNFCTLCAFTTLGCFHGIWNNIWWHLMLSVANLWSGRFLKSKRGYFFGKRDMGTHVYLINRADWYTENVQTIFDNFDNFQQFQEFWAISRILGNFKNFGQFCQFWQRVNKFRIFLQIW